QPSARDVSDRFKPTSQAPAPSALQRGRRASASFDPQRGRSRVNVRVIPKVGLAALVAALVVLPLAASGGAAVSLTRVSQDNIVDGIALHQSEQQSQMAAALGTKSLVGVFQVGRIYDGGASAIGFTQSVNGNAWKHGLIPLTVQS